MPAKQKKGRGRGRVAATPDPQPTESVHAPAASDEESSEASTVSETVGTKKKKITVEREKHTLFLRLILRFLAFDFLIAAAASKHAAALIISAWSSSRSILLEVSRLNDC